MNDKQGIRQIYRSKTKAGQKRRKDVITKKITRQGQEKGRNSQQ